MNLLFILATAMCSLSKIKYMDYPICKTCVHFLPEKGYLSDYGKCNLFGKKNIITGEITYQYADLSRMIEKDCNITGKYHHPLPEQKPIWEFW